MFNRKNKTIINNNKKDQLPRSRKEQFKRLFLDNYMKLVMFSMITFLFVIPTIVLFLIINYQTSKLLRIENPDVANIVFSSCLWFCLYGLPCQIITSLGFAGLFSVMKKFVWDEPVLYSSFFKGIKENYKQFIFIFSFAYIFFVLFLLTFARFYYLTIVPTILRYLLIGLSGLVLIIAISMSLYMCTSSVRYKVTIKDLIINSFKLCFKYFFINILLVIMISSLWIINLFVNPIAQSIIYLLLFIILISLFALIITSYHASIYDENVNKIMFPEIYRKGLKKD